MKIDIDKLIFERRGEKMTKRSLAKEMVAEGLFKNELSAANMLQYHRRGDAKGCDYLLLEFLCRRFDKKIEEIIQ